MGNVDRDLKPGIVSGAQKLKKQEKEPSDPRQDLFCVVFVQCHVVYIVSWLCPGV